MTIEDITLVRKRTPDITYRPPRTQDGASIWRLIGSCEPLDSNSLYCNLLQCDHFGDTCVVAERAADAALVGWISAYLLPDEPDTLFVWQVAVDRRVQGMGVGKRLLWELLQREACESVDRLQTTITADNKASWALFSSLARACGGALGHEPHFRKDAHFDGRHPTEHMVTIDLAAHAAAPDRPWTTARNGAWVRGDDAA